MVPGYLKHGGGTVSEGFDIIGDVHGEADALQRLLDNLGYAPVDGCWQHSSRRVIFLGDFIDRGPEQRRVLEVVIPMVQSGNALAYRGASLGRFRGHTAVLRRARQGASARRGKGHF